MVQIFQPKVVRKDRPAFIPATVVPKSAHVPAAAEPEKKPEEPATDAPTADDESTKAEKKKQVGKKKLKKKRQGVSLLQEAKTFMAAQTKEGYEIDTSVAAADEIFEVGVHGSDAWEDERSADELLVLLRQMLPFWGTSTRPAEKKALLQFGEEFSKNYKSPQSLIRMLQRKIRVPGVFKSDAAVLDKALTDALGKRPWKKLSKTFFDFVASVDSFYFEELLVRGDGNEGKLETPDKFFGSVADKLPPQEKLEVQTALNLWEKKQLAPETNPSENPLLAFYLARTKEFRFYLKAISVSDSHDASKKQNAVNALQKIYLPFTRDWKKQSEAHRS